MTFSLSLFLGLVLLLPGLALFAGLFAPGSSAFRAAPPPPNSLTALTLVVAGACLAHLFGLGLHGLLVLAGKAVALGPPPYAVLFDLAAGRAARGAGVFSFLALTVALSAASGWAAWRIVGSDAARATGKAQGLARFFYGWLAEIVVLAHPPNRYVNAYVLCDMESETGWIGYQGTVAAMTVSADKEVVSVLLRDANMIRITETETGVRERVVIGGTPLERLHIAKEQILNIAFEIYEVEEEALEALGVEFVADVGLGADG
jgi:hypothetical protein